MSVRLFTTRLVNHGRYILQSYWRREIYTNILEQNQKTRISRITTPASATVRSGAATGGRKALNAAATLKAGGQQPVTSLPRTGIFRFGQHARKLFIDNILNRVTTTYSEELRTQATKKLFYGDSAPFFALIGVSLASGAGVLTKEDELEGVCWEIREAASRLQAKWNTDEISESLAKDFNIDKLDVGPPIAKGCAAVVYAASFKSTNNEENLGDANSPTPPIDLNNVGAMASGQPKKPVNVYPEMMSPIQNMSRFVHNFGSSVDSLQTYNQSSAAAVFMDELSGQEREHNMPRRQDQFDKAGGDASAMRTTNFAGISGGAGGGVGSLQGMEHMDTTNASICRYPLALKMMFNYDIQSNALSILRAMYKETVPARQRHLNESSAEWERLIQKQTVTLPHHPNIVCMYGFFCDEVRNFPGGHLLYPIAQPQRINPMGYGRNMSLYLLMKRYDYSLRALLDTHELSMRTKLLLFAQLLEAVAHINRHGVAHRDLKSDNILIELNDDLTPPVLVLSDFGCCLADKVHGLQLPYTSVDMDKGGNAALMAPEIINKQPGAFSMLNYSKSDLWACGAIAYEIFGLPNPFYSSSAGMAALKGKETYSLRNSEYKQEDLPPLCDECPALVRQLIYNILNPNPSKRVSPDIAANVMQLFLWAPSTWMKIDGIPNSTEILQWLLSLTTKVMAEGSGYGKMKTTTSTSFLWHDMDLNFQHSGRRTYVEYLLICSFLARARLRRIRAALNWIQNAL